MIKDLKTYVCDDLSGFQFDLDNYRESELLEKLVDRKNPFMNGVSEKVEMKDILAWVKETFDTYEAEEGENLASYMWILDSGKAFTWDDFFAEIAEVYKKQLDEACEAYQKEHATQKPKGKPAAAPKSKEQSAPAEKKASSGLSNVIKLAFIVYAVYLAKKFIKVEWFKQGYEKLVGFLNVQPSNKDDKDKKDSKKEETKNEKSKND